MNEMSGSLEMTAMTAAEERVLASLRCPDCYGQLAVEVSWTLAVTWSASPPASCPSTEPPAAASAHYVVRCRSCRNRLVRDESMLGALQQAVKMIDVTRFVRAL